ncbi:MAG: hypothetical protein ACJ8AT_31780 [Hyalangium sp.]|uniref:hypothetical protein n=1 Tax=Hyalangium sp. TaxID=2028555 RepID=UPI003899CD6B
MKIRFVMGGLVAAILLCAGPALAVEAQQVSKQLKPNPENVQAGLDVQVGFGNLTGDLAKDTGTGPLLGITGVVQPFKYLGFEAGYEGQRIPIDYALVPNGEGLWRHNAGLLAKAGPLVLNHLRPFVGVGAGLSLINPSAGAGTIFDNDLVEEVPLAAGVEYHYGKISAGARATYRLMFGESFADALPNEPGGNLFTASATLGGRF